MPREPASTYRLQLNATFTFDDAANVAAYLSELGISHAYCSPYLQAAPGSMHGYDVVDHQRVNEELGGEEGHQRFSASLAEQGLGQILDIVPNHMAIGATIGTGGMFSRTALRADSLPGSTLIGTHLK